MNQNQSDKSNCSIYFSPEAYSLEGQKLMGRNAAGAAFLRGFLKYSRNSDTYVQIEKGEHGVVIKKIIEESGSNKDLHLITQGSLVKLKSAGVSYFPGPNFGKLLWERSFYGHHSWSLCGITHTTSSATAMDGIADLIASPSQEWDALICTSNAVKNNVQKILSAQVDYFSDRYGGKIELKQLQLPVIPLGVHAEDFQFSTEQKKEFRKSAGLESDEICVLFMGRLSFHAKANPLAMFQALEKAAINTGKKITLILCGWYANESIRDAYLRAAQYACPSIRIHELDGKITGEREIAWGSADIFCSLVDNIQESFGLTPLEAMASAIPVVVSDWDGYKDTIREGVDGFRIPTYMPKAGYGKDLMMRYSLRIDNYDYYCGYASNLVAVDIQAAADAFIALINSQDLREKMGQSGRKRVLSDYDWSKIIHQYETLWTILNEIRVKSPSKEGVNLAHSWPARMDPFYAFDAYPSGILDENSTYTLTAINSTESISEYKALKQLFIVNYINNIFLNDEEVVKILTIIGSKNISSAEISSHFDDSRKNYIKRGLAWLQKLGLIQLMDRS
jgi:glycosyltransferase involved in cell wall biosynthesis